MTELLFGLAVEDQVLSEIFIRIKITALSMSTNKKLHLNETPSRFTYDLSINEIYTLILAYILQI